MRALLAHRFAAARGRVVAIALAVSVAGAVVACGGGASAGLDGTINARESANIGVRAGEPADFTAVLMNRSGHDVTLESVTLLALKGFREPKLYAAAVQLGKMSVFAGRNWPAWGVVAGPVKGHIVHPGTTVKIPFAVLAQGLGNYAVAGLAVKVRRGGSTGTVRVISPSGMCVVRPHRSRACSEQFDDIVEGATYH